MAKHLDQSMYSITARAIHFDSKIGVECETFSGTRFIVELQKARAGRHLNRWLYSRKLGDIQADSASNDSSIKELKQGRMITIVDYNSMI